LDGIDKGADDSVVVPHLPVDLEAAVALELRKELVADKPAVLGKT
jgi:hypothetical protein